MAIFLGIILLVLVTLPLVIQLLQGEAKQSVNRQKSTVAFELAETAVAKAVATLTASREDLTNALAGTPVVGYNDDREYDDTQGGKYKVKISPGSSAYSVLIVGKGVDSSSREVRAVEAEYSTMDPQNPAVILNQGYTHDYQQLGPTSFITAHWGSIKSFNNVDYPPTIPYPRLISAGKSGERDTDPSPPNTNNVDYWAYQTRLGTPPVPDLAYYKLKAQGSVFPSTTTKGYFRNWNGAAITRNPPESGYIQSSLNPMKMIYFDKSPLLPRGKGNYYTVRNSTSVLFFDSNAKDGCSIGFKEVFLDVEAVIFPNSTFQIDNTTTNYHVFGATIPSQAPLEYQGTIPWGGGTNAQAVWANNFAATYVQANQCCYNIPNLKIHGYVYMAVTGQGGAWVNSRVLGVAQVQGDPAYTFFNDPIVYYDPAVLKKIKWAKAPLYRLSWKESKRSW